MRSLKLLGDRGFRTIVRQGTGQMPAFAESNMSNDALEALESYIGSLPTSDEQAGNPSEIRLPQNPNRYQGPPTRYGGSFSAGWYTSNGYPVLVAVVAARRILSNEGTINGVRRWHGAGVADSVKTTTVAGRPPTARWSRWGPGFPSPPSPLPRQNVRDSSGSTSSTRNPRGPLSTR